MVRSRAPSLHVLPNIAAEFKFPIYVDRLLDDTLVVSNFGNCSLYRIDVDNMEATLLVDGSALGMKHAGNCVVDDEGYVWLNEIEGCKIWRFAPTGEPVLTLGNGEPGFQSEITDYDHVRFNWIYDIRKGPDGNIYVLDSKNYAVRMIDIGACRVHTPAGTGRPGYDGTAETRYSPALEAIPMLSSTDQYPCRSMKKGTSTSGTDSTMLSEWLRRRRRSFAR